MLAGKWTYRSYRNQSLLVDGDAARALALLFGEGVFDLHSTDGRLSGALGMGTDYALTLSGTETQLAAPEGADAGLVQFGLVGLGIAGTPTAGWRYDYRGIVAAAWPNAIAQVPALVGTVIRVNAHGASSPAGVTASFIAVRQLDSDTPRSVRNFALLA